MKRLNKAGQKKVRKFEDLKFVALEKETMKSVLGGTKAGDVEIKDFGGKEPS